MDDKFSRDSVVQRIYHILGTKGRATVASCTPRRIKNRVTASHSSSSLSAAFLGFSLATFAT